MKHHKSSNQINFSIITPVKDDIKIFDQIQTFKKMRFKEKIEYLIICNGSTKNFIAKIIESIKDLKYVHVFVLNRSNISAAINYGIKKMNSSKMIIVDSDCLIDKDFVIPMSKSLNNNLIVRGRVIFQGLNPFSCLSARLRNHIYQTEHNLFFAPNLAFNKSVFLRIGYFNETLHSWDSEFGYRANKVGFSLVHAPKARVIHVCGDSILNEIKVSIKYGEGRAYCYQRCLLGSKSFRTLIKTMRIPCVFCKKESFVYNLLVFFYVLIWNFGFLKTILFKRQLWRRDKIK
ncbi:MAG: glycosyltransferase [Candidatus Levybacteria bacterium]|nr:glycosyltransferase [Candidatus Levybacteria bacterium]